MMLLDYQQIVKGFIAERERAENPLGHAKECMCTICQWRRSGEKAEKITQLEQQHEALSEQLETDRTAVADCLTRANRAIDSRHWLTEGRGSYEWNDDRWHEEFYQAAIEIKSAIEPLTKIATDWKACPMSGEAIANARINLKQQHEADTQVLREARKQLESISFILCGRPLPEGVLSIPGQPEALQYNINNALRVMAKAHAAMLKRLEGR